MAMEPTAGQARVRLSFFIEDDRLEYRVNVAETDSAEVAAIVRQVWEENAQILLNSQTEALRCTTPLAALQAMGPPQDPTAKTKRAIPARYRGQNDRSVVDLVETPFGVVPFWFFGEGRDDTLFYELRDLYDMTNCNDWDSLSAGYISGIFHMHKWKNPSRSPSTLAQLHSRTLVKIVWSPEIVYHHLDLWPLTTPDLLLDDLGLVTNPKTGHGRSRPVAALALAGGLNPEFDFEIRNRWALERLRKVPQFTHTGPK
jgi:hypothetical protein